MVLPFVCAEPASQRRTKTNPRHYTFSRSNISPFWLVSIYIRTATITTAGIAFCSLFITAMTALGDTVLVPANRTTVITEVPAPPTINSFVRDLDNSRFQLIEKKDNKEVYRRARSRKAPSTARPG